MIPMDSRPVVLVFDSTDPVGGGGLQAAIEVLRSFGTHPATIVTAITVQDSTEIQGYAPLDGDIIIEQARAILEDMAVAAILVGMLPNGDAVDAVNSILLDYPDIPLILSPSVLSSQGVRLVETDVLDSLVALMFPLATTLILNSQEAFLFSPSADSLDACAGYLLDQGIDYLLLTGSRDPGPILTSVLYAQDAPPRRFQMERFPQAFHGAGDTLAAAIAAGFARDDSTDILFDNANAFCHEALRYGYRVGLGRTVPDRFFWVESPDSAPS